MKEESADVVFAVTLGSTEDAFCELVVTDQGGVYLSRRGKRGGRIVVDEITRKRRDSDGLLWEVERICVGRWAQRYGTGELSDPGSWHVMLEQGGRYLRWRGAGEYPPDWDEFCTLLERFLGFPFVAEP